MPQSTSLCRGISCATTTVSNNNAPTISAGNNYTIPIGTAYELRASASDPDNDTLYYCWEQLDSGPGDSDTFGPTNRTGPMARSHPPTTTPIRIIPNMSQVLSGNLTQTDPTLNSSWETVSSIARTLTWGLTVRDRQPTAMGQMPQTVQDQITITVVDSGGPFRVTSQNNSGIVWEAGTVQTITWDVAKTNTSPINAHTVSIYLSTDGGYTYPITLSSETDNDGQAEIVVPGGITANNVRIKIQADNAIFFAVNDAAFQLAERDFTVTFNPISQQGCNEETDLSFDFTVNRYSGFAGTIALRFDGLPDGVTASLSKSSFSGNDSQGTVSVSIEADENHTINVVASSGAQSYAYSFNVGNRNSNFESAVLISPQNQSNQVSVMPTFNWEVDSNADSYQLQVSKNEEFTNLIVDSVLFENSYALAEQLESETTYYWRIKKINLCGESAFSEPSQFRTAVIDCSEFTASNLPLTLADASNSSIGVVTSSITVDDDVVITDLNVAVDITHTWLPDLILTLIAPNGERIILAESPGNFADQNLTSTVFDQEATENISDGEAPFTGSFRPKESLSNLNGIRAAGTWQLEIQDTLPGDIGTLNLFEIIICFEDTDNTDGDGDGVPDDLDQCPDTLAGSTVNENGCALYQLDTDNDGVSDDMDQCPNTPAGEEVDENGCLSVQIDADLDGVLNEVDQCPETAAGSAVNENGCALYQLDSDNDGVSDDLDQCPNTLAGSTANENGCALYQLDTDNDGVNDAEDNYPNTPENATVDINGGVVIHSNALSFTAYSATCPDTASGKMVFSHQMEYALNLTIAGEGFTQTIENIETNQEIVIDDLNPGAYELALSFTENYGAALEGITLTIAPAQQLNAKKESVAPKKKEAKYRVSGAEVYYVSVNNRYLKTIFRNDTKEHFITLALEDGNNQIEISTDKACQKPFIDNLYISEGITVYPNPTSSTLFVEGAEGLIQLFNLNGSLLFEVQAQEKFQIDMSPYPSGRYLLKAENRNNAIEIKHVLKQ